MKHSKSFGESKGNLETLKKSNKFLRIQKGILILWNIM